MGFVIATGCLHASGSASDVHRWTWGQKLLRAAGGIVACRRHFLLCGRQSHEKRQAILIAALYAFVGFAFDVALPAEAHLNSTGMGPIYDGMTHFLLSPEDLAPVLGSGAFGGTARSELRTTRIVRSSNRVAARGSHRIWRYDL